MMALVPVTDWIVTVARPIEIGTTAAGLRRLISIAGGEVRGPRLRSCVLPGDYQIPRRGGDVETSLISSRVELAVYQIM
jgi:hypothetical protein